MDTMNFTAGDTGTPPDEGLGITAPTPEQEALAPQKPHISYDEVGRLVHSKLSQMEIDMGAGFQTVDPGASSRDEIAARVQAEIRSMPEDVVIRHGIQYVVEHIISVMMGTHGRSTKIDGDRDAA